VNVIQAASEITYFHTI